MVQRAFSLLSSYPPERIQFLAPEDKSAKVDSVTGWSRILDETWTQLHHSSPERLKVQIADGPGDEQASEYDPPDGSPSRWMTGDLGVGRIRGIRHTMLVGLAACLLFIALPAALMLFAFYSATTV